LATHKSALKRHRQSLKRRSRNQAVKSQLRTLVKKVREAIEQKDAGRATTELRVAARALDKAVTKGVVHRNNASRRLARLARRVNQLQGAQAG
jgi:small subunit ribosomal protein S20